MDNNLPGNLNNSEALTLAQVLSRKPELTETETLKICKLDKIPGNIKFEDMFMIIISLEQINFKDVQEPQIQRVINIAKQYKKWQFIEIMKHIDFQQIEENYYEFNKQKKRVKRNFKEYFFFLDKRYNIESYCKKFGSKIDELYIFRYEFCYEMTVRLNEAIMQLALRNNATMGSISTYLINNIKDKILKENDPKGTVAKLFQTIMKMLNRNSRMFPHSNNEIYILQRTIDEQTYNFNIYRFVINKDGDSFRLENGA